MKSGMIINFQFHRVLRICRVNGQPCTVGMLAEGIHSSRPHVSLVLNGTVSTGQRFGNGRGGRTRIKLVRYFQTQFPESADALLAALGWDKQGRIVPRGENHVVRQDELSREGDEGSEGSSAR